MLTVKVTNTEGDPVPDATVVLGWYWYAGSPWVQGPTYRSTEATTDTNGNHTFIAVTRGRLGLSALKEGYYKTSWGSVTNDPAIVRIRAKQHPVPMYAKDAHFDLPKGDGAFGYDMFQGDLVAPFGVGLTTDLVLHVETTSTNWRGRVYYQLHGDVSFPNKGDGIQDFFVPNRVRPTSAYALPFEAPLDGYYSTLKETNTDRQNRYRAAGYQRLTDFSRTNVWYWTNDYQLEDYPRNWEEGLHYFLKVRSRADGSSCFGFVRGGIRFSYRGADIPHVEFRYYINPDGTRNIEYDPARNLVKRFGPFPVREYQPGYP